MARLLLVITFVSLALAKTDLGGCTSTKQAASIVYYLPDTGEICSFLECGGGRAPPKTTVPGCPQYTGTDVVTPVFLEGFGKASSTSANAASSTPLNTGASSTANEGAAPTTPAPSSSSAAIATTSGSPGTNTDGSAPTTSAPGSSSSSVAPSSSGARNGTVPTGAGMRLGANLGVMGVLGGVAAAVVVL